MASDDVEQLESLAAMIRGGGVLGEGSYSSNQRKIVVQPADADAGRLEMPVL
jgi:hypothetical protein